MAWFASGPAGGAGKGRLETDAKTQGAADAPPTGPIIIARHGRPALDRRAGPRLSWQDYVDWWARYEAGSLAPGQVAPETLKHLVADAAIVLSSPRPRALETARLAAPAARIETDTLFHEAPLPPPELKGARFLPKTWNVLARTWWLFGHTLEDGEDVGAARARAAKAASRLHEAARQGKVFLAAHGWFNRMMRPELNRLGWHCVSDGGDRYWSFRMYEYRGDRRKPD